MKETINLYKITFNQTWDGVGGRAAKQEFEKIKVTERAGCNEQEAINDLPYKNVNVIKVEFLKEVNYQ